MQKGDQTAKAVVDLLEKWDCVENVAGLVFDTTASNTGHKTACISIQKRLDKAVLWFVCRHHIGEIILAETWNVLKIEETSGSKMVLFTKLKEHWDKSTMTVTRIVNVCTSH